jgi:hypothetical protein
LMLLTTWSIHTTFSTMRKLLKMLIKQNKVENMSTKDFILNYYDKYIKHQIYEHL